MTINASLGGNLSPREVQQNQHEKDMFEMQANHSLRIKQLDLELGKLEAKWASWLRIPVTIIKLPVMIVMGVAYCIALLTRQEPSENFWRFLR